MNKITLVGKNIYRDPVMVGGIEMRTGVVREVLITEDEFIRLVGASKNGWFKIIHHNYARFLEDTRKPLHYDVDTDHLKKIGLPVFPVIEENEPAEASPAEVAPAEELPVEITAVVETLIEAPVEEVITPAEEAPIIEAPVVEKKTSRKKSAAKAIEAEPVIEAVPEEVAAPAEEAPIIEAVESEPVAESTEE